MAINCQKKVRASSRKKAQVLTKTETQNSVFSFLGFNLETYRSMTTAGSPSLQRPSRNRVYSQVMKELDLFLSTKDRETGQLHFRTSAGKGSFKCITRDPTDWTKGVRLF